MPRVIALLFIGLLVGVFAAAAQAPANSGATPAPAVMAITASGCLGGAPGAFTLTPNGASFVYRLEGQASKLQSHVGQQVEITGTPLTPLPEGSTNSANHESASENAKVLQVQQITLIADHCDPIANGSSGTSHLPRSATILPLLGIVGLGSLAASLIMRR